MTLKECYNSFQGNYEDTVRRLMNDRLVERFLLKFPQDDSMQQLHDALTAEDYDLAFRSAHTLKGVAANLGFTALQNSASALTEQLRSNRIAPAHTLVQRVTDDYQQVLTAIERYRSALL